MSSSSNIQKSRSSSSAGADQTKVKESSIEKTHISTNPKLTETLNDLLKFPLMDAIAGRRSRRFCMGAEIPDGVLAYKSASDIINYGWSNWLAFCYYAT